MRDETVAGFLNNLGAKQPTPGGGAVSALNGAIAASQLKMICEYSKDEEVHKKAGFLTQKVETFLDLAEADIKAFLKVSEAYRSNDTEQINSALIGAIAPSINIIDNCEELVDFCEESSQNFNAKLKADFVVVLANIKASARSAKAMIKTNVESLGENTPKDVGGYINMCDELLVRIDSFYGKLGA